MHNLFFFLIGGLIGCFGVLTFEQWRNRKKKTGKIYTTFTQGTEAGGNTIPVNGGISKNLVLIKTPLQAYIKTLTLRAKNEQCLSEEYIQEIGDEEMANIAFGKAEALHEVIRELSEMDSSDNMNGQ